jgi:cerevisin
MNDPFLKAYNFTFDTTAGIGVDIYVVDSGVRVTHREFSGRATWGVSFVDEDQDNLGHGTHCAGTAAGITVGLAKVSHGIVIERVRAMLTMMRNPESKHHLGSSP